MNIERLVMWSDAKCGGIGRECTNVIKRGEEGTGLQPIAPGLIRVVCLECAARVMNAHKALALLPEETRSLVSRRARDAAAAVPFHADKILEWLAIVEFEAGVEGGRRLAAQSA